MRLDPSLRIITAPLLKIIKRGHVGHVLVPDDCRGLILTSENGADAAPVPGRRLDAWCVGERTASAARRKGYEAHPADGGARSLVKLLLERRPEGSLIWLRGQHVAMDILPALRSGGLQIDSIVAYDQLPIPLTAEAVHALTETDCVLPVYSARTAKLLSVAAAEVPDRGHRVCCISQRTADAFELGWACIVPASKEAMIDETLRLVSAAPPASDH
ncbi:MAG: uroporphyrinogen-III synthase [Rhodobacteraceae bacterium]|nr:uroporphyrinogen-III synthase [Paracoccaceae bacterium]